MHTIRLRGPWNFEAIARFVPQADGTYLPVVHDLPPSARATMPADWSASFGADFVGRVRYHRVFQTPTGLDSGERVFLVVEPPRTRGTVKLADRTLGIIHHGGPLGRYDITDQLEDHNRLEVIVEHPQFDQPEAHVQAPGGLVGEVRLEIEEA